MCPSTSSFWWVLSVSVNLSDGKGFVSGKYGPGSLAEHIGVSQCDVSNRQQVLVSALMTLVVHMPHVNAFPKQIDANSAARAYGSPATNSAVEVTMTSAGTVSAGLTPSEPHVSSDQLSHSTTPEWPSSV